MNQSPVEVLLATCNGERFLRQQIDSILTQDYPAIRILAADDGSSDATPQILAEYAARLPGQFHLLTGLPPTGSAKANFLRLMRHSTAEYICFCDQDDVWLPAKVSLSVSVMERLETHSGTDRPLLVFTDLTVVDGNLRTIHPSMWGHTGINPATVLRLERLLGQAIVTGCTMTINRPLLELARQMPPEATMHDRWIALLAASLGASDFLRQPQVLYRQHDRNVIGATAADTSFAGLQRRFENPEGRNRQRRIDEMQVEALHRQHGCQMSSANAKLLLSYLASSRSPNAFMRIWLTLRHGFLRQGLLANLALLLEPFRGTRGN